ncbi:MAG: polysaccharide deacetylase family protein, partial [Syntrophomonadaceae bacterium]|nr:polysaccharide deacetylase family protein [Syntrophomonadaceae bacterium]
MKVVFLSRSGIRGLVSMVVLLACFIGLSLVYLNQTSVATKLNEPVYQGNTGKKMVAITVNVDWGEEYIPRMLEEFKKNDAVVTFYVTGKWAEKNSELLKQMAQSGHSVHNHGDSHLHLNNLARQDVA